MFEAKNCPKCGKIFSAGKDPMCPECMKKEEETFNLVRDYLKENPHSTMVEITEATGVSAKKINKYLREGRLEITDGIADFLKCMHCGTPIRTGKFCRDCASKITKSVQSAAKVEVDSGTKGIRMHYRRD